MRRRFLRLCEIILTAGLVIAGCGSATNNAEAVTDEQTVSESEGTEKAESEPDTASDATAEDTADESESEIVTSLPQIDMGAWQYNEDDDVYYQIGISYCETPADESYEKLAVFVPGAYMNGEANSDGTYSCTINGTSDINGYTAETAPVVMPINTPGYSAQSALTEYTSVSDYMSNGFIYAHAGCRGRDAGAPSGVTDLKAAVRYLRYNSQVIAGDMESIFTFGMSGGGAQSALMGSTGDSELYDTYLTEIGAVQGVSDAVCGSMCWCPITNLDTADEAYEWMMGTTRSGLSDEEQQISDKLAEAFADYINSAGIKDESGNALKLEASSDGIYQAGSYYDYMKSVIEESLEHFLVDTEFPYDASASSGGGMGGGPGGGGMPDGEMQGGGFGGGKPDESTDSGSDGGKPDGNMDGGFDGGKPDGDMPDGNKPDGAPDDNNGGHGNKHGQGHGNAAENNNDSKTSDGEVSYEDIDDITRNDTTSGLSLSGTYETAQDYIDAMNENEEWVKYDSSTGKVTITSIEAFVKAFKSASKNIGAFDQLDGGQGENTLFGYGDGKGAHFDATLAEILESMGSDYATDYADDLKKIDSAGNTVEVRLDMYTPLYYLLESKEGYGKSSVAKYWRIRTGIAQGDCALSTEMNLALSLENYNGVESVDFETIWGAGHTQAERTGDSTSNFIEWVNECMAK